MPRTDESQESLPAWLLWPVRALAVAVVLPFRLLGELSRIVGRFLARFVGAPLVWLWEHLIVAPLAWLWTRVLRPPLAWLGRGLVTVLGWVLMVPVLLVGVPLMWLWEKVLWPWVLAPVGRAAVWFLTLGWQGTTWLFRQVYRFVLRPVGRALAFVWRWTLGPVFRAVAWAGRWVRDEILRPAGAAIRAVFTAIGF